jgi:hypothetical protein
MAANVFDTFTNAFGVNPNDDTLAELLIDTPCGKACAGAIEAAKGFEAIAAKASPEAVNFLLDALNVTIETFWRG